MAKKWILGKKLGMTQIFTEEGKVIPVTVVESGNNVVIRNKTVDALMRLDLPAGVDIEIKV